MAAAVPFDPSPSSMRRPTRRRKRVGQFMGARSDFVPEEVCVWLRKLQDQVPPISAAAVEAQLRRELGCEPSIVFESIDLDAPLGAASIAQVHKARLRQYGKRRSLLRRIVTAPVRLLQRLPGLGPALAEDVGAQAHRVAAGEDLWAIANKHGVSMDDLGQANERNASVHLNALRDGDMVMLPASCSFVNTDDPEARRRAVIAAVRRCNEDPSGPTDGVVAVKVQYPEALPLFMRDLGDMRRLAGFLSRTELAFDLVSAIDELSGQVALEFDFRREARVMDTVAHDLRDMCRRVVVPTSIPGLVSKEVLVMRFLDGIPLTQLGSRTAGLSRNLQKAAFSKVLKNTSEAYGRMILGTGLFQADGHPGNILVMKGGKVGLIDYGQSKQLEDRDRLLIARLIVALNTDDEQAISQALDDIGVVTEPHLVPIRAQMASGMFDTAGKVDPFDENSPIKQCSIVQFPKQMFLVLRVVQLFRGMASRMDVEFSSAQQWRPFAETALRGSRWDEAARPIDI